MRTFKVIRDSDVSGVSGTGTICEGVEFEDGQVAVCWLSKYHCIEILDNLICFEKIHGHGGLTRVVMDKEAGK